MRRYHLSKKKIKEIKGKLAMDIWPEGRKIEIMENKHTVVLFDDIPMLFKYHDYYCPTVLFLLQALPEKFFITVDMGAVKHVLNGADIFAAGIVDADSNIKEGNCVYVRDNKYNKPIAVGIALLNGPEMITEKRGKAVKNIHYYGDEITQS